MPALKRIHIEGFKSIRNLDLDLRPLNVLIGANGSGKSNLVGAFRFLNELVNRTLALHVGRSGGVDTFLHFSRKTTERLVFTVEFVPSGDFSNSYSCQLLPTDDDRFVFEEEVAYFHDRGRYDHPYGIILGSGHLESKLPEEAPTNDRIVRYVKSAMESWRIYHFHDTGDTARVKQTGDIDDNDFLRPDAANLAAYLYLLQKTKPAHYRNIVDAVRLIAPFFEEFVLRPSPLNPEKIRLEWRERGTDAYFNAHSLSDGTLRFICLATLLLQPQERLPATILLDEPELGLHPYAIAMLAGLLRSASLLTQVVVSTQSVTLVNQFGPEDLIVVEREGGQSTFRRLRQAEVDNWLDEYGLGDLWEKNVLGGRPAAWHASTY